MAIRDTRGFPASYSEKLAALIETETQMGERAALLADIADALSHFPDSVEVGADHIVFADRKVDAVDWLSLRDLGAMMHMWREQRASVDAAWGAMSVDERAGAEAPPVITGTDPTRAWV